MRNNFPNLLLDFKHLKYIDNSVFQNLSRVSFPAIQALNVRPVFPMLNVAREISERCAQAFNGVNLQFRSISDQFKPLQEVMERLVRQDARCQRLETAGWMSHPSSPWHLLDDESLSVEALNSEVETYYQENWSSVRNGFVKAVAELDIDDEAKATFLDALSAHEAGLFRCVARTLFPEIERVSRSELHDGAMDKIASQPKLKDAISNLCPSDIAQDGILGMRLYRKLISHLYVSMPTPETVATIAADPVPNRHAAVHGYVSYNTLRHSINALIIAEYLLYAITAIKAVGREIEKIDDAKAA